MNPFTHTFLVPFHLADLGGILFFGHVFTLAHQTFELFLLDRLKIEWKDWFQHPDWIVPIQQTEASYASPIYAGDLCKIQIKIIEIRSSSFSLSYELKQRSSANCQIKTVHVFCDRSTKKKQLIPEFIRNALKQHH